MEKIFCSFPNDSMKLANPKYNDVSYIADKHYIIVQLRSDNLWYVTVYLRPYKNESTIISAYVPQLKYINMVKSFKFKACQTFSEETLKVLSPSNPQPTLFVSDENDITGEDHYKSYTCVHKIIHTHISPKLLNKDYKEFNTFNSAVNEIINFTNNYLKDLSRPLSQFKTAYWVRKVDKLKLRTVLEESKKTGFYGNFFGHINSIKDASIKSFVIHNKFALVCKDQKYGFGNLIRDTDRKHNASIILLVEIFDEFYKGSGYFISIELEEQYMSWYPKVNLGELIEGISIILNHVNKVKWASISESAYKAMPESVEVWFYTNPYHHGVMLHRYIKDNDREDWDANGPSFVVEETYLKDKCSLDSENFWTEWNFSSYISEIINEALALILEFERYRPIWEKKTVLGIITEVGKAISNPWKYIIRKLLT